jgi:hypothetical protein
MIGRPPARLLAGVLVVVLLPLAACTPQPATAAVAELVASNAGTAAPEDGQAIHATIDRLNEAAGGTVAEQQAAFAAAVEPSSTPALNACPRATTTVRFLPVYSALRPTPDRHPADGTLNGTVYALPTLVRIYTGDRVTATDLTTLHFGVAAGEAFLTPLCIN